MNIIILLLVTIFSYVSFLYGRSRIKEITSTQSIKINALPNYYGYYLALWCAIPALVILLLWSIFEPTIINSEQLLAMDSARRAFYRIWLIQDKSCFIVKKESGTKIKKLDTREWGV